MYWGLMLILDLLAIIYFIVGVVFVMKFSILFRLALATVRVYFIGNCVLQKLTTMLEISIAQIIFTKTNLSWYFCFFLNFSSFEGNTSHLLRSTRFDNNFIGLLIRYKNGKIAIIMFYKKRFDFFKKV